jgi:hypothetical protein
MRATWSERSYWLAWSVGAGSLAFAVLWVGINAMAMIVDQGSRFDFPGTGFFIAIAAFLLASALVHNVITGVALRRLLAVRARQRKEALVGEFD